MSDISADELWEITNSIEQIPAFEIVEHWKPTKTNKEIERDRRREVELDLMRKNYLNAASRQQTAWMHRQTTEVLERYLKIMNQRKGIF